MALFVQSKNSTYSLDDRYEHDFDCFFDSELSKKMSLLDGYKENFYPLLSCSITDLAPSNQIKEIDRAILEIADQDPDVREYLKKAHPLTLVSPYKIFQVVRAIDWIRWFNALAVQYPELGFYPFSAKVENLLPILAELVKKLESSRKSFLKIEKLVLVNARFTTLPFWIHLFGNLKELNLEGSSIKFLPPQIKGLKKLEVFAIPDSELRSLPKEILELPSLQTLRIGFSNQVSIPPTLWKLSQLRSLEIKAFNENRIDPEIKNLQNLEALKLRLSPYFSLPEEIEELKNLGSLELSNNGMSRLQNIIGKLKALRYLGLSNNRFLPSSFDRTILELHNLEILDIRNNLFSDLPEIFQLAKPHFKILFS